MWRLYARLSVLAQHFQKVCKAPCAGQVIGSGHTRAAGGHPSTLISVARADKSTLTHCSLQLTLVVARLGLFAQSGR